MISIWHLPPAKPVSCNGELGLDETRRRLAGRPDPAGREPRGRALRTAGVGHGVPLVRGCRAVIFLAAISLAVAGCSAPTAELAQRPGGFHVTCADAASDAGRLQHAIDASPPRAV